LASVFSLGLTMEAYIIPSLVFLLCSGLVLYGHFVLVQRQRHAQRRLAEAEEEDATPRESFLGHLAPALAAQIPITNGDRTALGQELRKAGYYRPTALLEYAAVRWLLTIGPVFAAGVLALLMDSTTAALNCWIGGLLVGALGYSLPRVYLYYRGKARAAAIERGLPVAIDMVNLGLSAGLNVLTSLQRAAKELPASYPVLAFELDLVSKQAELRTLEFAMLQFADRSGLPNVRNLAVILSQSETLGTDALATLREYADSMRTNMRQRADEMANKAPFKLLFPAYLMAIGAAVLIITPSVLEFNAFRRANTIGALNEEARKSLNTPGSTTTAPPPAPANFP
jgi:tight adherence protein C